MTEKKAAQWDGISEIQLYLFNEGTNYQAYNMLGAHKTKKGWRFAVWAPHADRVALAGDFNDWTGDGYDLTKIGTTGVWYGTFSDINEGMLYKYAITSKNNTVLKADPFAFFSELRPRTASVVRDISHYKWGDKAWLAKREKTPPYHKPMLIYEMHLGSWKTHDDGSYFNYSEYADFLIPYLKKMNYTHVELMPLTEYPFDGSWGYQVTGYFSATSRYGTPEDFKCFIDKCHNAGISVIMDWVPAHFPKDLHGLYMFDGTPTFEYADSRLGEHKDWGTMVFDYSKKEVVSFLMSSAFFWAQEFHIDGLRVDAVSSMLYRDYSRNGGEWLPNRYGGNENLEAVEFLQNLNKVMFKNFPNILMIAEESTAWSKVTGNVSDGGLGFNYKWNMGWMNDTLRYMSMDPLFRKPNHNLLTFIMCYAYSENFILPLSHDEVVHGKHSLIDKMFGDYEQKFKSYRTLLGYYMSMPGKKLLFMGGEFGQFIEWRFAEQLEWHLLKLEKHKRLQDYVSALNEFYLGHSALWEIDDSWDGFEWINSDDCDHSVLTYMRKSSSERIIATANFTPVRREKYSIGVPSEGSYEILFSSNWKKYGGETAKRRQVYKAKKKSSGTMPYSIDVTLDGLSFIFIGAVKDDMPKKPNSRKSSKKTEKK